MLSRWMPPCEQPETGLFGRAVLVVLAAGALWYLLRHPVGFLISGGVLLLLWLVALLESRRISRRALERAGEDICTFARDFDRRSPEFDPWIVRAVWDALAPWRRVRGGVCLPLRATDAIAELGCVDEDVDDVLLEAASRAGRSVDHTEANPLYGRVVTVGDLVAFIANQPRVAAA